MEENDIRYELIAKELTSEITEEELELLDKELGADEKLEGSFHSLKNFWMHFFPARKSHNIIEKTEKKLDFTYDKNSGFDKSIFYKIAATFFFLLSVGITIWFAIQPEDAPELKEYTCGAGEVKKVVLPDGTGVWLNNMSVLVTLEPFEKDYRRVKLIGEAYFDVSHNAEKPFVVETFGLRTEVLGTSFNINAYPGLKYKEILLYEGSVKISPENDPQKSLLLKPGEKVRVADDDSKFYISGIDSEDPAVWREGILEFRNEEFFQIARKLERKFNTRIYIASRETGKLRFTAEFEKEPLDKILKLLKEAKSFNYSVTDEGVIISSVK